MKHFLLASCLMALLTSCNAGIHAKLAYEIDAYSNVDNEVVDTDKV